MLSAALYNPPDIEKLVLGFLVRIFFRRPIQLRWGASNSLFVQEVGDEEEGEKLAFSAYCELIEYKSAFRIFLLDRLEFFGIFWNLLESFGIFWDLLETFGFFFGSSWIFKFLCIFWIL